MPQAPTSSNELNSWISLVHQLASRRGADQEMNCKIGLGCRHNRFLGEERSYTRHDDAVQTR